jgi:hypothetical protein
MLGEEIPNEGLTYVTLQQNVLSLLKTIAAKITNDRNPNSWEKAKLRKPVVQGISSSQLSTISMNTGRTNTPDSLPSSTSSLTPISVGTGGFLKTKKQKRKNNRNMKTKRRKNKHSNKKSKKNHRRRKQRKQTRKQ